MASNSKRNMILGAGVLALLLFSGSASASEEGGKIVVVPPPKDPPEDDPPQEGDYGSNWGSFPEELRGPFLAAEKAARLPGMARFLAIWSWGAFRAKKAFVTPQEAAEIAEKNPLLCSGCQNLNDAKWSRKALERVTLPIEEGGAYDPPWPSPEDFDAWADFGSAGLFDLLSGSVAHLGIHEKFLNPYLDGPPDVLFDLRPQLYYAGNFIHRVFNSPLYKVLSPTSADTWARVRAVTSSPQQFLKWQGGDDENIIATTAMANFIGRAKELGIDLNEIANPTLQDVKNWPGASSYFEAVEGIK